MKKIIIVGNGSYSSMMKKYIDLTEDWDVCAYVVEEDYIRSKKMDGIDVLSFPDMQKKYDPNDVQLVMGIGYTQMSRVRERIFEQCKESGYHFVNYIHPTAIISKDIIWGEGNNILEGVIIEAGVSIGNANLFFGGSIIGHESTVGNYNTFSISAVTAGCVQIGNNNFFGVSSAIRDHVTVENYVLVGATAYGFKDLKEYSVVVPAKSEILTDKKSTDYL